MSKFVSRAAFVGAAIYSGATAQTQRGQLWDAMQAAYGLTDVNRTTVTASGALTLAQCGTLLVDASAGSIVLTLPASGAAADEAVYEIYRIDTTAFTVTVARAGTDTINGAASVLVTGNTTLRLPAGAAVWRVMDEISRREIQNQTHTAVTATGTATAFAISPSPAITAYAAGQSWWVTFAIASGTAPTLAVSGIAVPPNIVRRLQNGTYQNVSALPAGPYRITMVNATQALAETVDPLIVGTVSQAAGVPTGAVIETITNANGTATRWADGTQICTGTFPDLALLINQIGGPVAKTFAAAFVGNIPIVSFAFASNTSTDHFGCIQEASFSLTQTVPVFRNGATAAQSFVLIRYSAIGRWF